MQVRDSLRGNEEDVAVTCTKSCFPLLKVKQSQTIHRQCDIARVFVIFPVLLPPCDGDP